MDDKNIREILIGKTFDEKVVLFAPISIGCLFIWEIPSLITDACFRYLIISLIIYWMIQKCEYCHQLQTLLKRLLFFVRNK